jgi:adenylate cyclase
MQQIPNTNDPSIEQRKLAAVMFADMTGYTAMMQDDETHAKILRNRQKQVLDALIPAHQGTIIQSFGDGTLSIFESSANAVRCGIAIQHELQKEPKVKLRIGIHSGDVVYDKEGLYGDCVNIASRIETLSVPGAVLFSAKVFEEIKNQKDIQAKSIGKFHLKNVHQAIEVYAASNEGMVIPSPSQIQGKTEQRSVLYSLFRKRKTKIIGLAVAAFLLTIVVILLNRQSGNSKVFDSIAVLPLENLSGNPEQDYFVSGMHETLITELSKIGALKVISRTSSVQYKNAKKPLRQIARELGVTALIEGSVIRDGNVVRITVQLINGTTDEHIWSDRFDRELENILSLYSEVAQKIAHEVKINLTPRDKERLVSSSLINEKTYEYYLKGRHYWNQRTMQAYKLAIENYKAALAYDSTYAPAYAGLADCYILLGEQGGLQPTEGRLLSDRAIRKALSLDPNLAEAYASLGVWKLDYEWNWLESENAFKRAVELNPGYALAYTWYGRMLGFAGRFEDAFIQLNKAKELDPLSPILAGYIGQVYIYSKQYNKAEELLNTALKLHPDHPLILHNIGELYLAWGRYEDAIKPLKQSADVSVSAHYLAMLGSAYARANHIEEANRILKDLVNRSEQGLVSPFDIASVYAALGKKEEALSRLEKGYEERDGWMKELKAWPWFDSLRNEPRYQNLMRRMNFHE